MGVREEAVARSFLDCVVARDVDAAISHYADDATYNVGAWMDPLKGEAVQEGVRREIELTGYHYTIVNIASTDKMVFLEVVDGHEHHGKAISMHWCGVWEINEAGKIAARRDYWDAKEFEAQVA